MAIVVTCGNEPYNIERFRRMALEGVEQPGMNVSRFSGAFTEEVLVSCRTFPFLSDMRAVYLDCDSQKGLDTKEFEEYLQDPSESCNLFISLTKADSRTKLIKKLTSAGIYHACNKYGDEDKVRMVLNFELKKRNASMGEDAVKEFLRRINYVESSEMNLVYMVNLLEACVSVEKSVSVDTVRQMVPEFKEPNVFGLIRLIKNKQMDALLEEIGLIPEKDAISVMSLLLRSYRISFKARFCSLGEVDKRARDEFPKMPAEDLVRSMETITETIEGIKQGRISADIALKLCCGRLCSI